MWIDVSTNRAVGRGCAGNVTAQAVRADREKRTTILRSPGQGGLRGRQIMAKFAKQSAIRRLAKCCAVVVLGLTLAGQAQAIHPRYRAIGVAGAGYYGAAYAGPGSFNPVGFGFGGYSYGGYPYYGYWGYSPGPYAGVGGYGVPAGPAYGFTGFGGYPAPGCGAPAAACNTGCAIPAPPCDPCLMTPCAYRRYLRRTYRAMARCCVPCLPVAAPCSYASMLGAESLVYGGEMDPADGALGSSPAAGTAFPGTEQVAPPTEEPPRPGLGRSF
jgi:hypothetical protein